MDQPRRSMLTKPPGRLTPEQRAEIKFRHEHRCETLLSMAQRFGISEQYCQDVAHDRNARRRKKSRAEVK